MWEQEGFALADGFDETTGRYQGLAAYNSGTFGQITDRTLVVRPEVAKSQLITEAAHATDQTGTEVAEGGPSVIAGEGEAAVPEPAGPENVRFFGVVRVNPEWYSRGFSRVAQEVLQHLAAVEGTQLDITVEITATNSEGFPADKARVVTENARTLKFDQFGFEQNYCKNLPMRVRAAAPEIADVPAYVAAMVRRLPPPDAPVVPGSTPVVAFGDPSQAEVASLGINPSGAEFLRNGELLSGSQRRLATLESLGAERLDELSDEQVSAVVQDCAKYFHRNPYRRWFDPLDAVLRAGTETSYYDGSACQLDLVQWARDPVWSGIAD